MGDQQSNQLVKNEIYNQESRGDLVLPGGEKLPALCPAAPPNRHPLRKLFWIGASLFTL